MQEKFSTHRNRVLTKHLSPGKIGTEMDTHDKVCKKEMVKIMKNIGIQPFIPEKNGEKYTQAGKTGKRIDTHEGV